MLDCEQACQKIALALVSSRIFVLPSLKELEELLGTALLEEAHEWALDSLHLSAGNLGDFAISVDEATSDLLELEITSNISVDKDLCEFARGDDELGNQVYGVVAVASELGRGFLVRAELAIKLATSDVSTLPRRNPTNRVIYLSKIETRAFTSIVVIAIHVEDLLALNRQKAREDTLRQAGTQNDDLNG
jgi:hypothetical protein